MSAEKIENIIFALYLPVLLAIVFMGLLIFIALVFIRLTVFLMMFSAYPLIWVMRKLSSRPWKPRSPVGFLKETLQSLPYLWREIFKLCLPR